MFHLIRHGHGGSRISRSQLYQLLRGNPKLFPDHPRNIVPSAYPGSSSGSLPGGMPMHPDALWRKLITADCISNLVLWFTTQRLRPWMMVETEKNYKSRASLFGSALFLLVIVLKKLNCLNPEAALSHKIRFKIKTAIGGSPLAADQFLCIRLPVGTIHIIETSTTARSTEQ